MVTNTRFTHNPFAVCVHSVCSAYAVKKQHDLIVQLQSASDPEAVCHKYNFVFVVYSHRISSITLISNPNVIAENAVSAL